ncbi:2Fe-2S iron-sulfur cluster binding domain-containing protein [Halomonas sp. MG34]|nr:2Fe-2S iron-sulfur cluster binding domain-containing protein [Halomonas sp. MG34]
MTADNQTYPLVIDQRIDEPGGIARLRLRSPDGSPLTPFTAGAHLDVHVCDGEIDLWRQYSLCSDPACNEFYEIGVLRDPNSRGGSETLHKVAREGETLEIEGPRNHFPLHEEAPQSLLFGGGIGVTPMIAMARRLQALGKAFTLHYCTRSRSLTAFRDEIEASGLSANVVYHHDDMVESTLHLSAELANANDEAHIYVCGPQGFMDWIIGAAVEASWPTGRVHSEYFNAEVDTSGSAFEVEAAASGVIVRVEEGVSIAQALREAGVKVDVSCEEGVCGTCICDVLEGIPDHRDHFLNDEEKAENDQMAICCSRAKSDRLVIDL